MANANLSQIIVSNTFEDWRVVTNNLIVDRNILRNAPYVKDQGDFRVANGVLSIARTANGTVLSIEGNANANIGGNVSANGMVINGNATVGNLTVLGIQTNFGDITNDSDLILLRKNSVADGDGTLRVRQASRNVEIRFNSTANVWQSTNNSTAGYTTLLTTANLIDSVTSTSLTQAPALNAVKTAYDLAQSSSAAAGSAANTARVSANGGSTLSSRQINFVNTSTVTVTVTSGAGGASGNANVAFSVVGGTAQGATGAQGSIGSQGTSATGSQGIQGVQGPAGDGSQGVGSQGTQGIQGTQGTLGTQGTSGIAGTITNETSSASTYYPLFTISTSGSLATVNVSSTKLSFQPSTGLLSATDFAATSDSRLKNILGNIPNATQKIEQIAGVEYLWNDIAKQIGVSEDESVQIGVLAQQVETLYPSIVGKNADGYLRVNYDKLVPILIESIKELNQRIKVLESK